MQRVRRVLIVRQAPYRDDPRVLRERGALIADGYEVDVLCVQAPGEPLRETVPQGTIYRLPVGKRRGTTIRYIYEYGAFFALASGVVSVLHLHRPYHAVQVHNLPDTLVFSAFLPKLTGTPVVLDMTEVVPELVQSKMCVGPMHPWVRAAKLSERLSTRFASKVVAVSEPALSATERRGLSRNKTLTIMNTPDPLVFPRRAPCGWTQNSKGIDLVAHGTLVHRYGFDTIVRAMPSILAELPESRLTIVGGGPSRPALDTLVTDLGLSAAVTFLGHVALRDVAGLVSRADIGIVANRRDEFTDLVIPTKLMEYASLGLPVVAARTQAIEQYVGQTVRLFSPGDSESLANAVVELAGKPDEGVALATRAQALVCDEWSWPRSAETYVRFYDELTAAP